eukprot:NODE_5456_length_1768_cov_7.566728.p1 GENE.NODE_5456_length_1768_cov_7.566728~~NODE_5456_length_1768_cov_7.566728.p1  ORF type:complete len:539 (+),score=143.77 NODE_5456_length_1768_cov_7.566728:46-1662(+)
MPARSRMLARLLALASVLAVEAATAASPPDGAPRILAINESASSASDSDRRWAESAHEVRKALLHAWRGYRKYAWGGDELSPISLKANNRFGGMGVTILDTLPTLHLMGLESELAQATEFVEHDLDFSRIDSFVDVFEVTIRSLGGLLSAHSLTGKPIFLQRARELGDGLLLAFNTTSGLPATSVNPARGTMEFASRHSSLFELARAGSTQVEFQYLSEVTGDPKYARAADGSFAAIQEAGFSGFVATNLSPPMQTPTIALQSKFSLGGTADSYYEYLLKQWMQRPWVVRFKKLWLAMMDDLGLLMLSGARDGNGPRKYRLLQRLSCGSKPIMHCGGATLLEQDHLACFTAGMIVLGLRVLPPKDLARNRRNATFWALAKGIAETCVELWTSTATGLAPETLGVEPTPPYRLSPRHGFFARSLLRPETVESLFYLHRATGDERYREQGRVIFNALMLHGKTQHGFATVGNVHEVPPSHEDQMQSFVLAETLQYLFLLFSPANVLDLDEFVLTTEAHPLRLTQRARDVLAAKRRGTSRK